MSAPAAPSRSVTRILGIETSCDETAAAVVVDGDRVLSSVVASQHDLHAEYGGVVPEIASRAHVERIVPVVRAALREAGVALADIDAVAVGHRPGLIGALLVGVAAAKALAWSLGKPIVGVDHVEAHLYSSLLRAPPSSDVSREPLSPHATREPLSPHATREPLSSNATREPLSPQGRGCRCEASTGEGPRIDLERAYPALGLVVSGGHTAMYQCDAPIAVTRLGSTIDDAMGEAFDKAAAILGLPHPGGPAIDLLAQSGDDHAHDFPVSRIAPDSLDFSFSGLKTAVLYAVRGVPQSRDRAAPAFERDHSALSEKEKADIAASFQRAACRAVTLKLERALERWSGAPPRALFVGGGVSANTRLRAELDAFARAHKLALGLPPLRFCVDNAAMIAGLARHRLHAGLVDDLSLQAEPTPAR